MIYIIPYKERFTQISKFRSAVTYVDLNGYGVSVYHSKDLDESELIPTNIAKYLIGENDQKKYRLEANSPSEAIEKFYKDWEKAATCGLVEQAIQISHREPIEELPSCPFLKVDSGGYEVCNYYCHEEFEATKNDPEPIMDSLCCVFDGLDDPPRRCPVDNTWELWEYDYILENIDGFVFKRTRPVKPKAHDIAERLFNLTKKLPTLEYAERVADSFHRARLQHKKLNKILLELEKNK